LASKYCAKLGCPHSTEYAARSVRTPALGLPSSYYDFTLEELQEATNNFDPENLVTEESQGQVNSSVNSSTFFLRRTEESGELTVKTHECMQIYKGLLPSGSAVLVKCIRIKEKHSSKTLKQHLEVISQLRHQNLVSVLGHSVATCQDRPKGTTIFVVFEHVTNGSLREHLTGELMQN